METNFVIKFEALVSQNHTFPVGVWLGGLTGLTKSKTKPISKLKLELKFGAELCNNLKHKMCRIWPC